MSKKVKGRMSAADRDYKKSQGKDLFVKGFALTNISELINVGVKTLSVWKEEDDWDGEKELFNIKPSEIKKMILEYVSDLKAGKTPRYKSDDISKIAAAFDRVNDTRKIAVYTMESFDRISSHMMSLAAESTGKKRDKILEDLKTARVYFDGYITELLQHD